MKIDKQNSFKIIFMGTPQFSVPALQALHARGHEIVLVVTQPDRPRGRGRRIVAPPVKTAALDLGCPVIQPERIAGAELVEQLAQLQPDFLVVIAFGRILPAAVLKIPRIAPVNVHASLLPKYRGPAPIHWAIINGEQQTGVCTMLMEKEMDTGDVLLSVREPIGPDDTAGSLHDRLAVKSATVLIDTLAGFAAGTIVPVPQDHNRATYAPMLSKKDGHIDWTRPADVIERFIRGVTPWPGAFTFHGNQRLKIFKSRPVAADAAQRPGTVLPGFADELRVATGRGALCIEELQGASGKRLAIKDFLRGHNIAPGEIFT